MLVCLEKQLSYLELFDNVKELESTLDGLGLGLVVGSIAVQAGVQFCHARHHAG